MPVEATLSLGALANDATVSSALTALGVTEAYVISADLTYALKGLTGEEGPLRVGLANDDLSVTEINEKLDARPTSQADIVAMERSRRPVRDAGTFGGQTPESVLNEGLPIRTTCKFHLAEGKELAVWIRNKSGATLTTGAVLQVSGTMYMRWQ